MAGKTPRNDEPVRLIAWWPAATRLLAVGGMVALIAPWANSASPTARGQAIAQAQCARCHAVGRQGESPLALAPPFRVLPHRYPVEQLAEAPAEGMVTGHPAMPEFTFEPDDIDALLTYMASLKGSNEIPGSKR